MFAPKSGRGNAAASFSRGVLGMSAARRVLLVAPLLLVLWLAVWWALS